MDERNARPRLSLGVCVGLAMALLSLYPQLNLWRMTGAQWNGSYAHFDFDEVAYSAYLNALIENRPRRNDPYTGRDDQPHAPQPESLFSIQFLPPTSLAFVARCCGLSASTIFILLTPFAAFASTLALFWLLCAVTKDERIACVGTPAALLLGGFAQSWKMLWPFENMGGLPFDLPFSRRYIPLLAFPFFFMFCALVWRALTITNRHQANVSSTCAGLCFAVLIYSYFFLWTAAFAWLVSLALLWLIAFPNERRQSMMTFGIILTLIIAALLPYLYLLSQRAVTTDTAQLLKATRAPELGHLSESFGVIVLLALALAALRHRISWRNPITIFTASLALSPLLIFNQQILTGHTLQPGHYDKFIANYIALLACVLMLANIMRVRLNENRRTYNLAFTILALIIFGFGLYGIHAQTRQWAQANRRRDSLRAVLNRFALPPLNRINGQPDTRSVVLCTDLYQADILPTIAPQPVLWAQHMFVFSGLTAREHKERLYQYLYYTGVDEAEFYALASQESYLRMALFGWERNAAQVEGKTLPLSDEEINYERQNYAIYIANFKREQAATPTLAFLVTPTTGGASIANLDRWYERDDGEQVGAFTIYRLTLRP